MDTLSPLVAMHLLDRSCVIVGNFFEIACYVPQQQAGVGLLDTDVMPMFMIIALDIVITMHFSINCSAVICSPTVIFAILREVTSETYGPRVSFPLY